MISRVLIVCAVVSILSFAFYVSSQPNEHTEILSNLSAIIKTSDVEPSTTPSTTPSATPSATPSPTPVAHASLYTTWQQDEAFCSTVPQKYSCTPTGYTIHPQIKNGSQYCEDLQKANISLIRFVGDSFIRHSFQTFAMLMSNDFERGSMAPGQYPDYLKETCKGDNQFEEAVCRHPIFDQSTRPFCDGAVSINLRYCGVCDFSLPVLPNERVVYGIGNHPYDMVYNVGHTLMDGIKGFEKVFFQPMCNISIEEKARVIWVSPHPPPSLLESKQNDSSIMPDTIEALEKLYSSFKSFQQFTDAFFAACGFNTQASTVIGEITNPFFRGSLKTYGKVSHDGSHFLTAANIAKAVVIMDALVQQQPLT